MSKWGVCVLTDGGKELLAKAAAGGTGIEFVHAAIGDGEYSGEEKERTALSGRTGIKNVRNEYGFSFVRQEGNTVFLKAALDNMEVEEEYYIREIGIFAKELGSGAEPVLYCIALADEPDFFPDKSSRYVIVHGFAMTINGEDAAVGITENMGVYALAEDLLEFQAETEGALSGLNGSVDELKKSVSDGKSLVASAITDQGVTTAADAAFATLATNIASVASEKYSAGVSDTKKGDAVAANVLKDKTFTSLSAGVNATGTMNDYSGKAVPADAVTEHIQDITTGQWSNSAGMGSTLRFKSNFSGYVDTGTTIGMNCYGLHPSVVKTGALIGGNGSPAAGALRGTYDKESSKPIATDKVLSGYIGFVNGAKITGAMTNRGAVSKNLNPGETYTIPAGYHNGSGKVVNNVVDQIEYAGGVGSMIIFPGSKQYMVRHDNQCRKIQKYTIRILENHSGVAPTNYIDDSGNWHAASTAAGYWVVFQTGSLFTIGAGNYIFKIKYSCHSGSSYQAGAYTYFKLLVGDGQSPIFNEVKISNTRDNTYNSKEVSFSLSESCTVSLGLVFEGSQGITIYGFDIWKIV